MGALLDTNVVLDALANREPWAQEAQDLLFLAACGKLDLYLSGSTITDVFYLVNRYVTHDKRRSSEIVDTLMQSLSVVNVGMRECLFAAHSPIADYEDAIVAEAARSAKLDCVVTRNLEDYAHSEVPAVSPHDYLAAHVVDY
ncbi:MAG: PIN domain-containing protein [Atopobiaceae bacterium]|nr:PIN domain-containing protein [Atopobiaceae bacterium]